MHFPTVSKKALIVSAKAPIVSKKPQVASKKARVVSKKLPDTTQKPYKRPIYACSTGYFQWRVLTITLQNENRLESKIEP